MYSPKISPTLIPRLYRLAKALKIPMTRLVHQLLEQGTEQVNDPPAPDFPLGKWGGERFRTFTRKAKVEKGGAHPSRFSLGMQAIIREFSTRSSIGARETMYRIRTRQATRMRLYT
jgi:hypothetical protein